MVSAPRAEQAPLRKGRGEGRGALGGLKHGWPWCTALLPRLEEVSHCWRGLGASVTPWNGLEQGQLCPGSSQHSVPVCVPNESLPAAGAVADCAPHVLSISRENKAGCSSTGPWVCGSGESRGDRLGIPAGLCPAHRCCGWGWTPLTAPWAALEPLPHLFLLHPAFHVQFLGVFCSQIDSHIHTQPFLKSQTLCLAEQKCFIHFKDYFIEGTTQSNLSHSNAVATGITNSRAGTRALSSTRRA